jgi:hypothetical protein
VSPGLGLRLDGRRPVLPRDSLKGLRSDLPRMEARNRQSHKPPLLVMNNLR